MKLIPYHELDKKAQELIRSEVESVITIQGVNWQAFEDVRLSEEKCGPPRYATNEIFNKLEASGVLSLKEGYGAYALQAGSLINIGPSMNAFGKYNFAEREELRRYVEACYSKAYYPIVAIDVKNLKPVLN